MKNKKILKIALILIGIGIVLSGSVFLLYPGEIGIAITRENKRWRVVSAGQPIEPVVIMETFEAMDFIDIDVNFCDIEFRTGTEFKINFHGTTRRNIEYSLKNSILRITSSEVNYVFNFFAFGRGPFNNNSTLVIFVPETADLSGVAIRNAHSETEIKNITTENLSCRGEFGDVSIRSSVVQSSLDIINKFATVTMDDVSVKKTLDIKNEHGDLRINNIDTQTSIVSSAHGRVGFEEFTAQKLQISSSFSDFVGSDCEVGTATLRLRHSGANFDGKINNLEIDGQFSPIEIRLTNSLEDYALVSLKTVFGENYTNGKEVGGSHSLQSEGEGIITIKSQHKDASLNFR